MSRGGAGRARGGGWLSARTVAATHAGLGVTMLIRPAWAARLLGAPRGGSHPVLRILGARHLLQAGVIWWRPTQRVVRASAAVDATHAASDLLYAGVDRNGRRPALRDAAVAAALFAASWSVRTPGGPPLVWPPVVGARDRHGLRRHR